MIVSSFRPSKSPKYWGTSHPFLSIFFPVRGFCYVSASKVDKCVICSLCTLVHKHNIAISFIAPLKVSIIMYVVLMYSSTQNCFSISANSAINALDTHLLCIVLTAWKSYLKGFLKSLHSEASASSLGMCPNFADFWFKSFCWTKIILSLISTTL